MQTFWNWCSSYQDIYDWISQVNEPSDLLFILTQQSVGEISMVNSVTCLFSLFGSTRASLVYFIKGDMGEEELVEKGGKKEGKKMQTRKERERDREQNEGRNEESKELRKIEK